MINLIGGGIAVLLGGALLLNTVQNPVAGRRESLKLALAEVRAGDTDVESQTWDFDLWNGTITGRAYVWTELVPPPPPPPPPPTPPPQKPDLQKMLEGVKATRQQVGQKVKIFTSQSPRGVFVGVGDDVNGLKVKSIDKTGVVLSFLWKEKQEELTVTLPRE